MKVNKLLNGKNLLFRILFRLIGKRKIKKNNYEIEMTSLNN